MKLTRQVLNSKLAQRIRRNLVKQTGVYCKIKKLNPTLSEDLRTALLLKHFNIDLVIDIGANTGQFAESLIDFGYQGKIVSFEPVSSAYKVLQQRVNKYKQWELAEQCAIGNMDGEIEINVSEDTVFSSIKNIKQTFTSYETAAKVIGKELVPIYRLDSLIGKYFNTHQRIYLKIDTQGYEKEVIEGAQQVLALAKGLNIEIPLVNNLDAYESVEWDFPFYLNMFNKMGFECLSISPISANKQTGIVPEVDGIFFRP